MVFSFVSSTVGSLGYKHITKHFGGVMYRIVRGAWFEHVSKTVTVCAMCWFTATHARSARISGCMQYQRSGWSTRSDCKLVKIAKREKVGWNAGGKAL